MVVLGTAICFFYYDKQSAHASKNDCSQTMKIKKSDLATYSLQFSTAVLKQNKTKNWITYTRMVRKRPQIKLA